MDRFPCSGCKKECLSELLGTYLLVTIGPTSIILASLAPSLGSLESLVLIGFSFGATIAIVMVLLGIHSGGVINPAITIGARLARTLQSRYLIPYISLEILGGLLAGIILRIFPSTSSLTNPGSTRLSAGIYPILGIVIEASGTFVLTISALVATSYVKSPKLQALLVGSTLFIMILLIGPQTGAGFNPARSLCPALASDYFDNLTSTLLGRLSEQRSQD